MCNIIILIRRGNKSDTQSDLRMRKYICISEKGEPSNVSFTCFISMESEIYCPLNEWRCIVLCTSGKAADWKLYAYIGRLAQEDWMTANERAEKKRVLLILTKLSFPWKQLTLNRTIKHIMQTTRDKNAAIIEINRRIGAELINFWMGFFLSSLANKVNGTVIDGSLYTALRCNSKMVTMHFSGQEIFWSFKSQTLDNNRPLFESRTLWLWKNEKLSTTDFLAIDTISDELF